MSNAVTMSVAAPNNGTRSSAFFATSIRVSGSVRPRALSTPRIVLAASASMLGPVASRMLALNFLAQNRITRRVAATMDAPSGSRLCENFAEFSHSGGLGLFSRSEVNQK
jgi:hypothetical protein